MLACTTALSMSSCGCSVVFGVVDGFSVAVGVGVADGCPEPEEPVPPPAPDPAVEPVSELPPERMLQ